MPNGRPIAVPRSHAGAASRNSAPDSHGRPVRRMRRSSCSRRTREATWNTSPSARIATVTVTSGMPSNSCGEPIVKRSAPVTASIPTTAMPSPSTREARPRSTESATTEEVATNAKSASAKYSAGPNLVENSASTGARNTTHTEATMPPMKAPSAAVARAWAARPS